MVRAFNIGLPLNRTKNLFTGKIVENYDKKLFRRHKTVDNPVETVHNMLYIRAIIQKLQKSYTIRLSFLAEQM